MENFNWVDYVFVAIFAFSTLSGLARGFIKEIVSLLALIIAIIAAATYSNELAQSFTSTDVVQGVVNTATSATGVNAAKPVSYVAIGVSFSIIFVGVYLVGTVIGFIINLFFSYGILGLGNRILGAGFGAVRGFLFNVVIIFIVQLTAATAQPWWRASVLVPEFQPYVTILDGYVAPGLANLKQKAQEQLGNVGTTLQNITK